MAAGIGPLQRKPAPLRLLGRYRVQHVQQYRRTLETLIRLDARLIPAALALWLFSLWALSLGTFTVFKAITLVLVVALGLTVLLLYGRELNVKSTVARKILDVLAAAAPQLIMHLGLIALLLGGQAVLLTARGIDADRATVRELAEASASVRLSGTVTEVRPAERGAALLVVEASSVQLGRVQVPLHETVRVYKTSSSRQGRARPAQALTQGSAVTVIGQVENRGGIIYLSQGHLYAVGDTPPQSATTEARNSLREYAVDRLGAEAAALTLGMAYGDDSAMPRVAKENYKLSGLSHLTAVSGANIAIIFLLAYRVGQFMHLPRLALIGAGAAMVCAYSTILGFEGSVVRALVMGSIGALGLLRGTGRNTLSTLSTATILCLITNPHLALDIGFALSVCATASLVLLAPSLTRLLSAFVPHTLAELTAAAASASLWCTPIILGISGAIPLYTIPANLLVTVLVPVVMFAGLGAFIAWFVGLTPVAELCLDVAAYPAGVIEWTGGFFATMPGNPWHVEVSAVSLGCATVAVLGLSIACWVGDALQYRRGTHSRWRRPQSRQGWGRYDKRVHPDPVFSGRVGARNRFRIRGGHGSAGQD